MDALAHLAASQRWAGAELVDAVLVNATPPRLPLLDLYEKEGAAPVLVDEARARGARRRGGGRGPARRRRAHPARLGQARGRRPDAGAAGASRAPANGPPRRGRTGRRMSGAADRPVTAVVLAAGKGKRMRSALPKVLHEAAGRPLLGWVLAAARAAGCERVVAVIGHGAERVRERSWAAPGRRSPASCCRPSSSVPGTRWRRRSPRSPAPAIAARPLRRRAAGARRRRCEALLAAARERLGPRWRWPTSTSRGPWGASRRPRRQPRPHRRSA